MGEPSGAHDRGGRPAGPIDRTEHQLSDWEILVDAVNVSLVRKRVYTGDEHRRAIESLPPADYERLPYYGRWITATEALLIEKGILTRDEIDRAIGRIGGER